MSNKNPKLTSTSSSIKRNSLHKSYPDEACFLSVKESDDTQVLNEQLKAAHDNIKFLKKEHACMLSGLHGEIEHLHDLCRDLQFRCEVGGCLLPESEFFQCSKDELEEKVNNLLKENTELKRKLVESHQAIDILDQKEKLALWQHHQELEQRDCTVLQLEKELEVKCNIIAQLTSQGARRKKSSFWRRFNFSASSSPIPPSEAQPPIFPESHHEHLTKEDLPSEIQHSLPSYESQYQSYSSYSSLSDKSVSDDEGFGHRSCVGKGLPDIERVKEDQKLTVKLPPISNLPMVSKRQLIRHQLRIRSLASKVTSDSLAIDQMQSADLSVKRLNKA